MISSGDARGAPGERVAMFPRAPYMRVMPEPPFKTRPTRWAEILLVCRKCGKRAGGGFGADGETSLAKALRKRYGKGRAASVAVVDVKCLKLCPKDAVTVARGSAPDALVAVPVGADLDAVAAALGLPQRS